MSGSSETGLRTRWERQEADRQRRRKAKKEQEDLEQAVQANPTPADNSVQAIISEYGGISELIAGYAIRSSDVIQNLTQNNALGEIAETIVRESQNRPFQSFEHVYQNNVRPNPFGRLQSFELNSDGFSMEIAPLPISPIGYANGESFNIAHETSGQGYSRQYLSPAEYQRLYVGESVDPATVDFSQAQDAFSRFLTQRISARIEREILGSSDQPSMSAQQENPIPGNISADFEFSLGPTFYTSRTSIPTKPRADLVEMGVKVARAQKLLIDSSNLLSRVIAGLDGTPEEAKALKARVDAGIQAFITD